MKQQIATTKEQSDRLLKCGVRHSNRTFNKLLKIKVTNPACDAYEEE